jgi:hypothetical protein
MKNYRYRSAGFGAEVKKVTGLLSVIYQLLIFKRPLRWKRMVACKRGLGSGPLLFAGT